MGKLSTHQRRARNFVQHADWNSALSEMRQALNSDANNPATHNQMGDIYLHKEDVDNACKHFEQAIDLYAQLGLHNNAVALCRKVMRLAPSRVEVRYKLARLRFDQGLRADGVAAFNDYLTNVDTQGSEAVATLEERCRTLVDAFPDAVPVGKILEKLESVQAFSCAFEIVQRLAQRAADAGDDESARKYTEKMRSLRVLVEGSGGGDLLAESPLASVPEVDVPSHVPTVPLPAPVDPPPLLEPPATTSAPAAGAPPTDGAVGDAASGPPPELELEVPQPQGPQPQPPAAPKLAPSLDALLASVDASPGRPTDSSPGQPDAVPEIEIDAGSAANDASPSGASVSEAADGVADADDDAGGVPEYELPEASLDEIADLLQPEPSAAEDRAQSAASQPREAAPPPTVEESFTLGAKPVAENPSAGVPASSGPPEAPSQPFPQAPGTGAPEHAESAPFAPTSSQQMPQPAPVAERAVHAESASPTPSQQMTQPVQHTESAARPSGSLRQPVWIPDPNADATAVPNPGTGQVHELEDVIETFRDQMAKALGSDASARYDLGVAYYEMGLYNEALGEFEAAVGEPRFREPCLEMMAACLAMQGRHADIMQMLAPFIQAEGANVGLGLRYTMGVACEALGLRDDARFHFEQIARIDSSYRDVQARLMTY